MSKSDPLDVQTLKARLEYEPDTGMLRWKQGAFSCEKGCKVAGWVDKRGRRRIFIKRTPYMAHRLVWLYFHGCWPKGELDHIDGNPGNNRIENLRDVTTAQNQQNRKRATRASKTGVLGVIFTKNRFSASITKNGKATYLGRFRTIEEAREAYLTVKRTIHEYGTL
jgi:HNH endonuclease